ncbi:MAG: class IV adenylate cyclase [Anaerolineaceae bacterium]|nr:class IV adenylate cyclase [Anaerolineaceae bacterium]
MANNSDQEIEVKFMIRDHGALEKRLIAAGAVLVAPRVHEINLRFDTPDWELTSNRRVLRLRQDSRNVLTYKGPAAAGEEVAIRTEIETEVADFGAAQRILEALGYRIAATYEKYRTTYQWGELEAVLDEMPYGDFLEIEGPDTARLQEAAAVLQLDWSSRSSFSYMGLFEYYSQAHGLPGKDLSFAALSKRSITPADLGLRYAD